VAAQAPKGPHSPNQLVGTARDYVVGVIDQAHARSLEEPVTVEQRTHLSEDVSELIRDQFVSRSLSEQAEHLGLSQRASSSLKNLLGHLRFP
jgi:hypothetical protein